MKLEVKTQKQGKTKKKVKNKELTILAPQKFLKKPSRIAMVEIILDQTGGYPEPAPMRPS